jgi:catechol 2,3-dioxygenase-like lactoylglutathione lyase family enzyme
MIHGIDHTALSVPDFDKALDFYCGVLGFEAEFKAGWPKGAKPLDDLVGLKDSASKVAMIKLGDTKIEVFQYENPVGKAQDPKRPVCDHGIIHLCFRVTDIHAEYKRLSDAGVPFNAPPVDLGREICAYGRDPFGNVFELLEKKQPKPKQ